MSIISRKNHTSKERKTSLNNTAFLKCCIFCKVYNRSTSNYYMDDKAMMKTNNNFIFHLQKVMKVFHLKYQLSITCIILNSTDRVGDTIKNQI